MNSEAVLIVGIVASIIAAAIEQLSGPGLIDKTNMGATIVNIVTVLAPLIAAGFTRFQVYSKASVAVIQAEAAATGTTPETSPP